jgi:glycosyltransferase involved in cell wall biosynthesis
MNGWFGISSLESLAHGLPVIAGLDDNCLKAIAEFTGSSVSPWVVARNETQLEEKLEYLITHPEHRLRIGQDSRVFMEQHWNEEKVLSLLLDTYRGL